MLQSAGKACHKSVRGCPLRLLCQEARRCKCLLPERNHLQFRAHRMHSQIKRGAHQVVCSSTAVAAEVVTVAEPQAAPNLEIPASRLVLRPNEVWYFAYGSNMNVDTLRRRRVKPVDSLPATSPGYVLTFSQSGFPYAEPCFASLDPAGPQHRDCPEAHGVLHRLTTQQWDQIQRSEGVGMDLVGYKAISVDCYLYDGQRVQAQTLTTSPLSVSPNYRRAMASERYLNLLRKGAAYHGVSRAYCAWLASLPSYEAPVSTRALGQLAVQASAFLAFGPMLALASSYTIATNVFADKSAGGNRTQNNAMPGNGTQNNAIPGNGTQNNAMPGNGTQNNAMPGNGTQNNAIPGKHESGGGRAGNQTGGSVSGASASDGGNNNGSISDRGSSSGDSDDMGSSSRGSSSSKVSSRDGGSTSSSSSKGSSSKGNSRKGSGSKGNNSKGSGSGGNSSSLNSSSSSNSEGSSSRDSSSIRSTNGSRHRTQKIANGRVSGENESVQDLAWKTVLLTFGLTQRAAWTAHDYVWRHVVGDGAAKTEDS